MEINSMLVIIMLEGIKLHCIMLIQYYKFVVSINIIKCVNLYRFSHYLPQHYLLMGILARLRAD